MDLNLSYFKHMELLNTVLDVTKLSRTCIVEESARNLEPPLLKDIQIYSIYSYSNFMSYFLT